MIVFYQERSHHHKTIDLPNETCTNCGNRGTLKMYLMQKYVWVLGPLLPSKKYAIIECSFCDNKIPSSDWNKKTEDLYQKEIKAIKTPVRMWRGAVLMVLLYLIPYTLIKLKVFKKAMVKPLIETVNAKKIDVKDFKEGDVLFISTDKTNKDNTSLYDFTLVKVIKIEGDKTILKKYTETFDFKDQNTLSLSAIDDSKFKEEIVVKTFFLREDESLVYYTKQEGMLENKVFGSALTILK